MTITPQSETDLEAFKIKIIGEWQLWLFNPSDRRFHNCPSTLSLNLIVFCSGDRKTI